MTATETAPQVTTEPRADVVGPDPIGGLAGLLGSGDHKVVGRTYIVAALIFALVSGLVGQIFAIDKADAELGNTILTDDSILQALSLHSVTALFLVLIPLTLGVALIVVPLQVGSQTVAFPRAAAASVWATVLGGGLLIAAYAIDGGAGGGSARGVDLWLTSLVLVVLAELLAATCLATTVIGLRAGGMTLTRVPLFSWSVLVSAAVWVLSLPAFLAVVVILQVGHHHDNPVLADGNLYSGLRWVFVAPQVTAFAVVVLGVLGDVVTTAARVRLTQRPATMTAIGALGALSLGAFAIGRVVDPALGAEPVSTALSVLAALPVVVVAGAVALSARHGRLKPNAAVAFAVTGWVLLALGVGLGAARSFRSTDLPETLFDGAHTHLVLLAATVALFGGLWHWATKIVGRPLPEGLGLLAAAALFLGALVLAVPDAISGIAGDGDEVTNGLEGLNVVSAVGGVLVLVGVLLVVVALLANVRGGDAPADPWDGLTLEWATASPPPLDNFPDALPDVTSPEPLLDVKEAAS